MTKDIRAIKEDSIWANLALLLLYPYSFLTGLTQMQGVHIIYPAFTFSLLIFIYTAYVVKEKKIFRNVIVVIILVSVFLLLNMLFVGNADIKNLLYGVFIMPSLSFLLFFFRIKHWVALILFYGVAFFFGAYILQNGPFVREETELLVNSRNYVSFFVVLYSLPYFVYCYDYKKTPSLVIPIICTLISIFALGRSGILTSMGLLIGVVYLKMIQKSRVRVLYRFLFCFILIILMIIGIGGDIIDTYFSRFSEIGMNTAGRTPAWTEYMISMLNPINFVLGTPIESLKYTSTYLDGSLHNSYLTLHAREGIMGLVLIVLMFRGAYQLYKRKCYSLFLIIVVLLFKGLADADMGGTYSGGDIYVFFLVLTCYYFKYSKYERKSISTISSSVPSNSGE